MDVTPFGMLMLVRDLQYSNALFPMEVTLFGMTMLVRTLQEENARSPMERIPSGIV